MLRIRPKAGPAGPSLFLVVLSISNVPPVGAAPFRGVGRSGGLAFAVPGKLVGSGGRLCAPAISRGRDFVAEADLGGAGGEGGRGGSGGVRGRRPSWWRGDGTGGGGGYALAGGLMPIWPVDLERNYTAFGNRTFIWQGGGAEFGVDNVPEVWGENRTAIITGANNGIGLEIARVLASKGWHVIIACRDKRRGRAAMRDIRGSLNESIAGMANIELEIVDLSDMASIRAFCWRFQQRDGPLHLLINNAGVMLAQYRVTRDGAEATFATNYLGPFLITHLLLNRIRDAAKLGGQARIVNVGSESHRWHPDEGIVFNVSKLMDPQEYLSMQQRWKWYGHSKLALHIFTKILDDALLGEQIFVNTVHPGLIAGGAIRHSDECFPPFFGLFGTICSFAARPWMRTPLSGALTPLFAATSPTIAEEQVRGQFLVPCKAWRLPRWALAMFDLLGWHQGATVREGIFLEPWLTGQRVAPISSEESAPTYDAMLASRLWDQTIDFVGYVPNHYPKASPKEMTPAQRVLLNAWKIGWTVRALVHHAYCYKPWGQGSDDCVESADSPPPFTFDFPFKENVMSMLTGSEARRPLTEEDVMNREEEEEYAS